VSDKTLAERPGDIKAFCKAFYEAQDELKNSKETAEAAFKSWDQPISDRDLDLGLPLLSTSPELSEGTFGAMADLTNMTISKADVTPEEVKDMYVNCDSL